MAKQTEGQNNLHNQLIQTQTKENKAFIINEPLLEGQGQVRCY